MSIGPVEGLVLTVEIKKHIGTVMYRHFLSESGPSSALMPL